MSNLITVPTFNFTQGYSWDGEEPQVNVKYYNSGNENVLICLEQGGNEIQFTNISRLKSLVKQIEKHLPEATKKLSIKK